MWGSEKRVQGYAFEPTAKRRYRGRRIQQIHEKKKMQQKDGGGVKEEVRDRKLRCERIFQE